jgi:riboflavin-specific deaminase-like protein
VTSRPYVLLSVATSIDGYIDDATENRLRLSNEADFERVDEVRAGCDAILVGAGTIRADNPKLLVRSPARQRRRVARGQPAHLLKATITASGDLDPEARFFTTGDAPKVVYAASPAVPTARDRIGQAATVVDAGNPADLDRILEDLADRGVRRLMVEGGGAMHTLFLRAGRADELQLAIAPFLIGDPRAPRFIQDGPFPLNPDNPARLADALTIGDLAVLRYALTNRYPGG